MDFTVEKADFNNGEQVYIINTNKVIDDVNGNSVIIPDRSETITLNELETQLFQAQIAVDQIQAKIDEIKKL